MLDPTQKQNVEYCIPNWLRDEQIKLAIARVKERITAGLPRPERIAVVCFGPSLAKTWEELRGFDFIISCSGAHKFLVERGIIPTWHVEVDPRAHKAQLIGPPHPAVEYLIASTCHPALFDHLEGMRVKLWHVFDNSADAMRTLPPNEWAITGGCSVGLRCMTIARFFGFRDLHIFGMDGSKGATGLHAAEHPNQTKSPDVTIYNGVTYETTPSMLEAARQTWHELDQLADVTAKFYGTGLVQAMAADYVPKKPKGNFIAFEKPETISAAYAEANRQLHHDNLAYGVGGGRHADTVLKLANKLKTTAVLDYGCGKGYLAKALPFPIWEYDPAVPGKEASPRPASLVVCTDVLEHIEPTHLDAVLGDLARCVQKLGYFVIHTGPSGKTLPDGRNSHLLQHGRDWWVARLRQYFDVAERGIFERGPLLTIIVSPKTKLAFAA